MYQKPHHFIVPLLTSTALASTLARAQVINESVVYEIPPAGFQMGRSVDVSNAILATGDPESNAGGNISGAVHLFDADTGAYIRTLIPSSSTDTFLAGRAVAIDGNTVVCNGPGLGGINQGNPSVFVFDAHSGQRFEVLPDADDISGGFFGRSVDVDDGVVAIGSGAAQIEAGTLNATGRVYLIDEMTGARLGTILSSEGPTPLEFFGWDVDIHNGKVAVSAQQTGTGIFAQGNIERVEIFDLATQQHLRTIYSPAVALDEAGFGYDIAMSNQYIAVAAPFEDDAGSNSGAVHVYDVDTGNLVSTIDMGATPNLGDDPSHGISIDINDDGLVIVSQYNGSTVKTGLYEASSGVEVAVLEPSFGDYNDATYGQGVALDGESAYVGDPVFYPTAPDQYDRSSTIFRFDGRATIAVQPQSLVVDQDNLELFMQVVATVASGYQWFFDGNPISEDDPNYTGVDQSLMVINSGPDVEGVYHAEVYDGPFTIRSEDAYYVYRGPGHQDACPADLTNDGVLDFFDVSAFLSAYGAGCP